MLLWKGDECMAEKDVNVYSEISSVVREIKSVLDTARSNVAKQVNSELLNTYWTLEESFVNTSNPPRTEPIMASRH